MLELPLRAKRLVAGSVLRTALIWTVPFVALVSSPWLLSGDADGFAVDRAAVRLVVAAFVVPFLFTAGLIVAFPAERYGDWVAERIRRRGTATDRSVNLADALGLATGEYHHTVISVASAIPNVAAIPGR